jgi:hypothetical protein
MADDSVEPEEFAGDRASIGRDEAVAERDVTNRSMEVRKSEVGRGAQGRQRGKHLTRRTASEGRPYNDRERTEIRRGRQPRRQKREKANRENARTAKGQSRGKQNKMAG